MTPINSPSKFDPDAERVRQRMDELRRHHEESVGIHNRTQPIINEQIHEETIKCLKSGQTNGTKIKSQKPRIPKRQRSTATAPTNSTTSLSTTINPIINNNNNNNQIITTNQISPQTPMQTQQHQMPTNSHQVTIKQHQPNMFDMNHIQQHAPPIHMQQHQPQHYASQHQPQPQQQHHFIYQQQPQLPPQPQQQVYSQQPTMMHHSSTMDPQSYHLAQQTTTYNHNSLHHHHHHNNNNSNNNSNHHSLNHHYHHHQQTAHMSHTSFSTLPKDLDLTLQAGLECDVDSLIKHEMSVEGQLDFNHDLIQRILF